MSNRLKCFFSFAFSVTAAAVVCSMACSVTIALSIR